MHDHTASVRACKDCGEFFRRWSQAASKGAGSSLCRCQDCYNAYAKSRPSYLAKRATYASREIWRPCLDCPTPVKAPRKRCESCGVVDKRAKDRERDRHRRRRKPGNWTRACACGAIFTRAGGSGYCTSDCPARKPKRVSAPRPPSPEPTPCLRCDVELVQLPRKRCIECARLHQIERLTSLYWVAAENLEIRKASAWRHQIVAYLRERDGDKCGLCDRPMLFDVKTGPSGDKHGATIDHIVPRSRGGVDDLVNLQLAHWTCNNRKGNRGGGEQLRLVG